MEKKNRKGEKAKKGSKRLEEEIEKKKRKGAIGRRNGKEEEK